MLAAMHKCGMRVCSFGEERLVLRPKPSRLLDTIEELVSEFGVARYVLQMTVA